MDKPSAFRTRRERQLFSALWIVFLPCAIGVLIVLARSRFDTASHSDAREPLAREPVPRAAPAPVTVAPIANSVGRAPATPAMRSASARDATGAARATEITHANTVTAPAIAPPPPAPRWESTHGLAEDADTALRENRNSDALNHAIACLQRDARDPRCLRAAAVASMRDSRFDDARPYVEACKQSAPDDPLCIAASAQLALHDRDLTLAGILSWRLSQLAPDGVDTYMARAQLADLQGDPAAAERSYRAACRAGQTSACQRLGELIATTSVQ